MMNQTSSTDYCDVDRLLLGLTIVVLFIGVFLRAIYLDSDPYNILWTGYITDEGRWTEQARSFVLFGTFNLDNGLSRIHLILSPLFQALTFVSFSLFGVSFSSARLVSVICGGGLLIASFLFLHRRITSEALLFSITALALQPDLLFLSRVAIPEMGAMLFEFLAFAALISTPQTLTKTAFAGFFTAIALALKATIAPIVVIFLIILVVTQRTGASASLAARVGAYFGVMIFPVVVVLCVAALQLDGAALNSLWGVLETIKGFIRISSLYSIMSFLFYGEIAPALNLLLLGAWVIAGLLMSTDRLPAAKDVVLIYTCSAIWVVCWLIASAILEYFPDRYVFHVLAPLILHLGAGVTLLQNLEWPEVLKKVSRLKGARLLIVSFWLSTPLAVLLCPIVIALAGTVGFPIDRFSEQLPLFIVLNVLLALFLRRTLDRELAGFGVVVLPLIFVLFWFAGVQSGNIHDVYWNSEGFEAHLGFIFILAIASIATIFLGMNRYRPNVIRRSGLLYLVAFGSIWLFQSLPGLINPTYSIARASDWLVKFVDKDMSIGTRNAASLFLNNNLKYEQIIDESFPEILVLAFNKTDPILDNYRIIHQQELQFAEGSSHQSVLKIYQLQN